MRLWRPGKATHLGMLLDGVIAAPRRGRARPVYCALRAYFMDLKDELGNRGFSAIGEQELPHPIHNGDREDVTG